MLHIELMICLCFETILPYQHVALCRGIFFAGGVFICRAIILTARQNYRLIVSNAARTELILLKDSLEEVHKLKEEFHYTCLVTIACAVFCRVFGLFRLRCRGLVNNCVTPSQFLKFKIDISVFDCVIHFFGFSVFEPICNRFL